VTASTGERHARRPWHLWVVGLATLAFFLAGSRDYVLVLARDTDYIVENCGQGGVGYFRNYPLVLRAVWTVNIVASVIAALLLLGRHRWSFLMALTAAVAQAVLLVATFAFRDRWDALGAGTAWFDIGVGGVGVALATYCWTMRSRGVLR